MSKEGDSLKFLKTPPQVCVMRVNICCDGCQRKVKKVLRKTDGVHDVRISVEERKVTVTGSVEPDVLVKKLNKAGKYAEVLSVKGGGGDDGGKGQSLTGLLQKLQLEHQMKENGKAQKEGGGSGGGGGKGQSLTGLLQKLQLEHQTKENGKAQKEGGGGGGGKVQKGQPVAETQQEGKGFKDFKFPSFKDLKIPFKKHNSKAASKLDPSPEEELDEDSEFDDELDDFDDEGDEDDELSDLDEYSDDELLMKPNGSGVGKDKGGEKGINGGGKNGGGANNNKAGNGNSKNSAGSHAHNGRPLSNKGGGSNNGAGGGLPFGNMHPPMGLMGSNNAQGPPAGAYFPPDTMAGGANPYQQQQYLQALMQHQQQQQRMMMNELDRVAFQPMGYGYGSQPGYMPQPHTYTMFSDENPNGCSIM